jgi:class I fructose-bisphosphate aldolase
MALTMTMGMATFLWCYLRNSAFKKDGVDHHTSADTTGQANHLGVTMLPTQNGGFTAINFAKTHKLVYEKLVTDNPVDLVRWQVANCYMGRVGMINSGGASTGKGDLAEAVKTAVINKRGGGMGLISGRKTFQRPMNEGVALFHAIQDVFLNKEVTIA